MMKRCFDSVQPRSQKRNPITFYWWAMAALAAGLALTLLGPSALAAEPPASATQFNDKDVAHAVNADLWVDEGVSANLVDVNSVKGVVTLSGSVNNLLAKERAVKIAKSIRGVHAVVDELEVRPVIRTDREVRNDIVSALTRNPATDSYDVAVSVKGGVATLKGQVDSWQEKQFAAQVASGVKGVTTVNNKLVWNWVPGRADSAILADIQQRLASDIWLDDTSVTVQVNDGKVTLGGTVGSAIEQSYATTDAWVAGVKSVNAGALKVDPLMNDPNRKASRYAVRSDHQIEQAAKAALALDPRVVAGHVTVTTTEGIAALTGKVESLQAKRAAEEDVGNTLGVLRVEDWLKVRPTNVPSDRQIARDIRNALKASPFLEEQEGIHVQVVNQEAYLSGGVETRFDKQTAGALAAGVKGVVAVHNNLALTEAPYDYFGESSQLYPTWDYYSGDHPRPSLYGVTATASDSSIRHRVEDQLFWSPFVDSRDIGVTVTNGVVTLFGTVKDRMERGAAVDDAYQGGARSVIDDLTLPQT